MLAVLAGTARLFYRHWPMLFTLWLAGVAVHSLIIYSAAKASDINAVCGRLVLTLAPVATLTALILMLRTVSPSLSWVAAMTNSERPLSMIGHIGAVLIPFLTVYVAYGYLDADQWQYRYEVYNDEVASNAEIFTNPANIDLERRAFLHLGTGLLTVVAIAVVLRWLLTRWKVVQRRPWLGIPGACVEVIWITLVARRI